MGRKAKPTQLKLIDGNPGRQKFDVIPDPPLEERPKAPEYLDENGLWAWNWLLDNLEIMGLLSAADVVMMEMFSATYMRYRIAEQELAKLRESGDLNAVLMKTKKGNVVQQPLIGIINQAVNRLKTFASEFGLTPSARASLGLDKNRGKKSKFEGYLGNRRG